MLQSIDLETLHHILKQFSENILNDSVQIICKLLSSANEATVLLDLRTFTSIKVLLNLYGKLCTNSSEGKVALPVNLIIQNIKKVLDYNDESSDHPSSNMQLEVLSVLQSLFKIPCIGNCSQALKELAKLCAWCVTCIHHAATAKKECKADCLMFKLKMVQTVYDILRDSASETNMICFCEISRSENLNECKVFADLVLHGDDNVAIQMLVVLIPRYIDCFNTDKVLEVIWKEISNSIMDSSINYSRLLLILYIFFDKYLDKVATRKEFYLTLLLEDANYWWFMKSALMKNDPIIRKQGMLLFKKTIEALKDINKTIICSKENTIFHWDFNLKDEFYKMYNDIITILEFLDEQQVHIIRPILERAKTLLLYVEHEKLSPSWVILVYHKALIHDSTEVVKWGLSQLLSVTRQFFTLRLSIKPQLAKEMFKEIVAVLVPALNTSSLYYSDGLAVSNQLKDLFNYMPEYCEATELEGQTVRSEDCEEDITAVFSRLFIKQVCSLVWNPEALFFVVHALPDNWGSFWGEDEICQLRTFVLTAFKTYNKIIAAGIQCDLLKAIQNNIDVENVSLKSIILLFSSFSLMQSVRTEREVWVNSVSWVRRLLCEEEARKVLDSCKRQELGEEFNEQSISLVYIVLYYFWSFETRNPLVVHLCEMLLLFKDIDRRPYCDRASYDRCLSVISHIYKANANDPIKEMLKPTLPLLEGVKLYIRSQLKQISRLHDFDTCQLYLNAFENITKVQKSFQVECEGISSSYADVLSDLETCLRPESDSSPFRLYCRIKFLNLLLELHPGELKQSFLFSYFLTDVNKPLEKEEDHHKQTRDIQTLWGRVNSEFIDTKWRIMEYLINYGLITHGPDQGEAKNSICDDDLVKLCIEGLNCTGGYGVLCPIMSILKTVLPALEKSSQARSIITSVWKLMTERRKTDEFKSLIKAFVEMLFQEEFILKGESSKEILTEYADLIFSDSSLAVVNIFMRQIQKIDLAGSSVPLYCHIIGKALIFGSVQRKDEKLTTKVCSHIEKFKICPVWETKFLESFGHEDRKGDRFWAQPMTITPNRALAGSDSIFLSAYVKTGEGAGNRKKLKTTPPESLDYFSHAAGPVDLLLNDSNMLLMEEISFYCELLDCSDHYTSNEVRGRAVERILTLDKDSERDQAIAKNLIDTLLKMDGEVGKNRERYFTGSHVHRVKHRVVQALLLLEPLLHEDQEKNKLLHWVYNGLLNENPQPSVRCQQEWLLIRMLHKKEAPRSTIYSFFNEYKIKGRGLCSLMAVLYHLIVLNPDTNLVFNGISFIVPLLTHQHFEVRLYTQVLLDILHRLPCANEYTAVRKEWNAFLFAWSRTKRDTESLRNTLKLQYTFLQSFRPLEHYSLETIYNDLPFMMKVGGDECISAKMFRYCGVDPLKIGVPLTNTRYSLRYELPSSHFCKGKDEIAEDILENYQRKIIPTKQWAPGWDGTSDGETLVEKEGGLVVVASLIDRIPNLGGLARTCEIFGVSEYVISSLRYMEDKQFTSLSVTAEKWIALKEVKADNLMVYILEMKQNGYTVVGAEQTLRSQPLGSFKFPKKTLLLLGNEKEGISPNLLPLLDVCVEIPQMGIIRSLNVHVTGALFIWEYAKQNNFS